MASVKLMVLYPHPVDTTQFDSDYRSHLEFLHQKTGIAQDAAPYTVTKFFPGPEGPAPFYQLFTMPFTSAQELQEAMSSPEMQAVAADAARISSGGAPVILVGGDD